MTVISKDETEGEVDDVQAISAMREQMVRLESVVTLKDEVEEEYELLREQREQLMKKSRDANQLLEDMRIRNENNYFVVESLKRSYEDALANANAALTNQAIASNHQIQRLEKLLTRQQMQLTRLGAVYHPRVKVRSGSKTAEQESPPGLGPTTTIPIERRRMAYLEDLASSPEEGNIQQSLGDKSVREPYLVQLEDEVLNLRIYLASETELRRALEMERQALYDQLKDVEANHTGVDIDDQMEFINATSLLSIEEQNSSLQKIADKHKMICSLNTLRRHGVERIAQLERDLVDRNGERLLAISFEIC